MSDRPVSAPRRTRQLFELLWPLEASAFAMAAPALRVRLGGDGHPVLVLPGFIAGDASTRPLRWAIRNQGHRTHGWGLGRNIGPTGPIVDGMRARLTEVAERYGRTVSLVGWSLGGVYARALAREQPTIVRQVISMGSPYRMVEGDASGASALWRRFQHLHDGDIELNRIAEQDRPKLAVPATSIYSRWDGVAPWQTCIDVAGPFAENIEVRTTHSSMGLHPAVVFAVLDRLRLPDGRWRPFRPPAALRPWYPRPVTWRPRRGAPDSLAEV
jgi:pimeloyl-ACP methyl ester carboxylesterase